MQYLHPENYPLFRTCKVLTLALEKLHFTHCQLVGTTKFVHQHFVCVEVEIDTDIPATCWLSTWWYCSNINICEAYSWSIPDIKVIWYSIESQSGKASDTVTVVVQCDGSQGDTCGEYEQQLLITPSIPHIIVTATVLILSKVRISQYKSGTITVDVFFSEHSCRYLKITWIPPTVGTRPLSSSDRVIMIGIL